MGLWMALLYFSVQMMHEVAFTAGAAGSRGGDCGASERGIKVFSRGTIFSIVVSFIITPTEKKNGTRFLQKIRKYLYIILNGVKTPIFTTKNTRTV
jgi:hypothetical protein